MKNLLENLQQHYTRNRSTYLNVGKGTWKAAAWISGLVLALMVFVVTAATAMLSDFRQVGDNRDDDHFQ